MTIMVTEVAGTTQLNRFYFHFFRELTDFPSDFEAEVISHVDAVSKAFAGKELELLALTNSSAISSLSRLIIGDVIVGPPERERGTEREVHKKRG